MRKFFFAIFALVLAPVAFAEQSGGVRIIDAAGQSGIEIECPVGAVNCAASGEAENYSIEGTQNFVLKIVGGALNFAAIAAVVMLVVAAIRLVTAAGNQDGLAAAKKQIMWTLGGLAVIILALLIVQNITEIIFENATPAK